MSVKRKFGDFMKRKVIQLAGKTLVVSLPSKWARQCGVVKGEDVELVEDDAGLLVVPAGVHFPKKSVSVDVRSFDDATIRSVLSVLHKSGFDEVEVLFSSPVQLRVIADRVRSDLLGFEIVQQSSQRVVVQSVAGDADGSFEQVMRRVFLVTLELAKGVEDALVHGARADELLRLEETINKLTNYCHRLLNRKRGGREVVFLYTLLWLQEKVGDDYKAVLNLLGRKKLPDSVVKFARDVSVFLREFYEVVYAKDVQRIAVLRRRLEEYEIMPSDAVSVHLLSVRQHILDGLGSATGLLFVGKF